MAEQRRTSLGDLKNMAKAAKEAVTGLGDQTKGPLVQGHVLGTGSVMAALRQGAKELAQVLPAFPDSARVVEEPGTIGNPTPQIVTAQLTGKMSMDDLRSYAKDKAQEAMQQMDRGNRGMEM